MSWYSIHFIISICLGLIVLLFLRGSLRKGHFLLGLVIVPLLSFEAFYNVDFSLLNSWFVYPIGYLGTFWVLYLYCFFISFKRSEKSIEIKNPAIKALFWFALQALVILILFLIPWAFDTFPLSNIDSVLFTFFAPIDGSGEFVISTLYKKVFFYGACTYLLLLVLQLLGTLILLKKNVGGTFAKKPISLAVPSTFRFFGKLVAVQKLIILPLFGCLCIHMFLLPSILYSPALAALFESSIDSEFYKSHYKSPLNVEVPQNENKKNLVVIFVESMANNFERYTPELNSWQKKGLEFRPGAESVAGTGWTIAGITSALCGLPLNMPMGINEYHGKLPTYLPNAVCMMELLQKDGYNQIYVQGTNADFTQKRLFWKSHGDVSIHDEIYFKQENKVPKNYSVFWGIEDNKTFSFAKDDLDSLASKGTPFALYLLTIDGHQPNGYLDTGCDQSEDTPYKNVLRCSSRMLGAFLEWMSEQSWYKNTIVVVVGDHTLPALSEKAGLPQDEKLYTVAFMLNSENDGVTLKRKFTNLDYAPTILEAMGWALPNHGFGLGRSLLSSEPTMLEIYGRDSLDALLRQRSRQFDYFLSDENK